MRVAVLEWRVYSEFCRSGLSHFSAHIQQNNVRTLLASSVFSANGSSGGNNDNNKDQSQIGRIQSAMKFGKVLQSTAEHFPEKQFIGYKKLKKFLKTLTTAATGA